MYLQLEKRFDCAFSGMVTFGSLIYRIFSFKNCCFKAQKARKRYNCVLVRRTIRVTSGKISIFYSLFFDFFIEFSIAFAGHVRGVYCPLST